MPQVDPRREAPAAGAHDPPCHPGQGRAARRWTWGTTVGVPLAMVLVPPLLVRAGVVDDFLYILAMGAPMVGVLILCYGTWPLDRDLRLRYLTSRTLFGRRTVDLDRLTRIRHIEIPARVPVSWLLLTDEHGVRLAVKESPLGRPDAVERAIRQRAFSTTRPVPVSPAARRRLRPEEPGSFLGAFSGCLVLLLGCALAIALAIGLLVAAIVLGGEG